MKKIIFLLLCLFAQNFYCAQDANLEQMGSLRRLCLDELLKYIRDTDFNVELDQKLDSELGPIKEVVVKEYMRRFFFEWEYATQIVCESGGSSLVFSLISADNNFLILYSGRKPRKLVILSTGLILNLEELVVNVFSDAALKYKYIHNSFKPSELIDLATNERFNMCCENPKSNQFRVTSRYSSSTIKDEVLALQYLIHHSSKVEHLRISNDSKYAISGSSTTWKIAYIDEQLFNKLDLIHLKLISWLNRQDEFNRHNIIVLDEHQNLIFNSLPRFMQFALLSHYKIEYTPMMLR